MISIHAPVKGATFESMARPLRNGDFNPRSREGNDSQTISTGYEIADFNPRSREGSDIFSLRAEMDGFLFQSTLP